MMTARLAKPEESETIIQWMTEQDPTSMNCFGKNTMTLAAENGELRMAMPVQAVLFIESIPKNPHNRKRDTVMSLSTLLDGVLSIAGAMGVKNIYFMGTTREIGKQAEKNGFERLNYPVYRRRV